MTVGKFSWLIAGGLVAGFLAGIIFFKVGSQFLHRRGLFADPALFPTEALPLPQLAPSSWNASLGAAPRLVDATSAAAVTFQHFNGQTGDCFYPEIMGGGVCLFDYNGDGLLDIFMVNGNRLFQDPDPRLRSCLYRNNGDWTFTEATDRAGVGYAGYGQGCCAADYDNDGDQDLYLSNLGPNVLYRNKGDGTFTVATAEAKLEDPFWGQSSCFLDYDRDGWLDLYVQNYLAISPALKAGSAIFIGDQKVIDYPSPVGFSGSSSHLYRNNGNGVFTEVTRPSGLERSDGKGMGCACLDFDDDGFTDIFVANDSMENYYFHNLGNGTFEEIGLAAGVAYDGGGLPEASMGVDAGDYDGDGRIDLIVPCLRTQVFTLYRNMGKHFEDTSLSAGLAEPTSRLAGFSANFFDYDNDGDLDLFFANGGVRRNESALPDSSYRERYGIQDLLLANDGKGRFADVSSWAGSYFKEKYIGRGSVAGDLDNDGRVDLVISNLADRPVILRNQTPSGHWVTFQLMPRSGNRDALGASLWLEAGGKRQRKVVHGGVTYLSQNDRRPHFGLGGASRIDRLEVFWPSGKRQVFKDLPVDRFLTIQEDEESVK